jgi:hypothetical protein
MHASADPSQRYTDKPFLKLLDAYVLWAIGALPPDQESLLQRMTPMLRKTWNCTQDNWHEVVAAQMEFPATLPDDIRKLWQKEQTLAAANKATLNPVRFAHKLVDQNFI